ncbi:MAG: hypothetical protein B1H09_07815 [Gemmatimonadaceae bacterium 4484_173]|nr:MAG: hypothetical protein B1H09_07815 [Gemmatimonadaceae bacterium 4484_173]RLC84592.1 MAG: hypothetical protein DRI37_08905 [Chloroflexota bacterium]
MGLDDSFSIRLCNYCGAGFVDPLPTVQQIRDVYDNVFTYQKEFTHMEEKGCRRYVSLAENALNGKTGRLLDIGCATGAILKEAVRGGWDTYGVDLSAKLLKQAALRVPEAKLFNGELGEANFHSEEFDVVIALNLLEHVLNPKELLEEVNRILRPGGIFLFKTVRIDSLSARKRGFNWDHLKWPGHFVWFTKKTLLSMLINSGYRIKKFTVTGIPFIPGVKRYMDHRINDSKHESDKTGTGKNPGSSMPLVKRATKMILKSWMLKRVFAWIIAIFQLGDTVTVLAVKETDEE